MECVYYDKRTDNIFTSSDVREFPVDGAFGRYEAHVCEIKSIRHFKVVLFRASDIEILGDL